MADQVPLIQSKTFAIYNGGYVHPKEQPHMFFIGPKRVCDLSKAEWMVIGKKVFGLQWHNRYDQAIYGWQLAWRDEKKRVRHKRIGIAAGLVSGLLIIGIVVKLIAL